MIFKHLKALTSPPWVPPRLPPLPPLRVAAELLVWLSAQRAQLHPAAGAQAVPRLASQAGVGLQRHVRQALRPVEGVAAENTPRSQPGECLQVQIFSRYLHHSPCWGERIPPANPPLPRGASQLLFQHVLSISTHGSGQSHPFTAHPDQVQWAVWTLQAQTGMHESRYAALIL